MHMLRRVIPLALALAIALTLLPWQSDSAAAASRVYVTTDVLNVRSGPSLSSRVVMRVYGGDAVLVTGTVAGSRVQGSSTWYRTISGYYVSGAYVSGSPSAAAGAGTSGRWIDVNLSTLTARAMVGNTAVYSAPAVAGKPGWSTPTGRFSILRRYLYDDMTSGSFGYSPGDPDYYYAPDVPYTQYFTNAGHAIHGNYWSPAGAFGNYNTSHGCVGLRVGDAAYFWSFASIGTPVVIHY